MTSVESRELSVESQQAEHVPLLSGRAARHTLGSRLWTLDSRLLLDSGPRRGLTLVELLVTIMIIGILAAAVLGVAAVAGETARDARTRNLIARIHTLLMQHYETYNTRRVKVSPAVLQAINSTPDATTAVKGRLKAEARMYALRELMLMEIPDRWSDILLNDLPGNDDDPIDSSYQSAMRAPLYYDAPSANPRRTELANLYLRHFDRIRRTTNKLTDEQNTRGEIMENQGAECLYMIVMNACADGEARTMFPEAMIGDTDGDGANEFIDGWGHPIEFLRWAPGFESDIQYNAAELGTDGAAWATAGSVDHDPFDLYRAQPNAFRLVPLVYSAGRDEEFGVRNDPTYRTWRWNVSPPAINTNFTADQPHFIPPLNPYGRGTGSGDYPTQYLGLTDSTATDNLHNHAISTRP